MGSAGEADAAAETLPDVPATSDTLPSPSGGAPSTRASIRASPPPPVVPGYAVGARLGAGGFGEVFRARHELIGRDVAIKILHAQYSNDPDAIARFIAEARAVNRVSHPGIVEIFDFGTLADGRQYCVMELLHGITLRELLRERGRLPLADALPILGGIAEAVDAAHAAGIAHRDLKPDNVFVLDGGSIKLIDFGLAKLTREESAPVTQTGSVFGTPLYMSPEQCRGKAITTATDVYSFGVLAYHVLVGETPFGGDALELALKHLNDKPPPPSIRNPALDRNVDDLILALLAKDAAARPGQLAPIIAALGSATRIPGLQRRHWLRWALVLAIGVGVIGSVAVLVTRRRGGGPVARTKDVKIELTGMVSGFHLSPDGSAIQYGDASGAFSLDIANGRLDRRDFERSGWPPFELPDGRWIVQREGVEITDPTHRTATKLVNADRIAVSRDGHMAAYTRAGHLTVRDLATGAERDLGSREAYGWRGAAAWSADGNYLAIGGRDGDRGFIELVELATGAVRRLPFSLTWPAVITPATFLQDGRLVYCQSDDSTRTLTLRARQVADNTGTTETVIATLPGGPQDRCQLDARGQRVAVLIHHLDARMTSVELDAPAAKRQLAPYSDLPCGNIVELSPDGEIAYYFASLYLPWRYDVAPPEPRELCALTLATGERGPVRTCPSSVGVSVLGGTLFDVAEMTRDGDDVELALRRPGGCETVHTWRLPAGGRWLAPMACRERSCALLEDRGATTRAWLLEIGAPRGKLLAEVASVQSSFSSQQSLVMSPDEQTLVVQSNRDQPLTVIATATGDKREIPGDARAVFLAWGEDADHIYIAGNGIAGGDFAVARLTLASAAVELIASSPNTAINRLRLTKDRALLGCWTGSRFQALVVDVP